MDCEYCQAFEADWGTFCLACGAEQVGRLARLDRELAEEVDRLAEEAGRSV